MRKIKRSIFTLLSVMIFCSNTVAASETTNFNIDENGRYRIKVTDYVGNYSYTEDFLIDNIDNEAPEIVISNNPNYWVNTDVKINVEVLDRASGLSSVYLNGERLEPVLNEEGSYLFSISVPKNGEYIVKAIDNLKHVTSKEITVSKIDKNAPTVTASWSGSLYNRKLIIQADDEDSGISKILVNGEKVNITPGNSVIANYLQDGSNKYVIYVYDAAGNATTITQSASSEKLSKIEIIKSPNKLSYYAGETFDETGMVVLATYVTGEQEYITNYNIINPVLPLGRKIVEISYTSGGITKTASISVKVERKKSISNVGEDDDGTSNGGNNSGNTGLGDISDSSGGNGSNTGNAGLGDISNSSGGTGGNIGNAGLGGISNGKGNDLSSGSTSYLGGVGSGNLELNAIVNDMTLKNPNTIIYDMSAGLLKYILNNITDAMIGTSGYNFAGYGQGGFAPEFALSGYNLDGSPIYAMSGDNNSENKENSLWISGLIIMAKQPLLILVALLLILFLILAVIAKFLYKNFLIQLLNGNKKLIGFRRLKKKNGLYYVEIKNKRVSYLQFPESVESIRKVIIRLGEREETMTIDKDNLIRLR